MGYRQTAARKQGTYFIDPDDGELLDCEWMNYLLSIYVMW